MTIVRWPLPITHGLWDPPERPWVALAANPVQIRGKGAALAMGWGRFGGMISPLVAGVPIGANSIVYVWCIMAAFLFTASGLTLALAYETRGNLELVSREA